MKKLELAADLFSPRAGLFARRQVGAQSSASGRIPLLRPMNTKNPAIGHISGQIVLIVAGIALPAMLLIYVALGFTTELVPARGGTYIEGMVGID